MGWTPLRVDQPLMLALSLNLLVPPTRRSDSLASVGGLIEPLRPQPDCIGCWLYNDFRDSNAFTLVEERASQTALDRHLTSSAHKTLVAAMELCERPPVVARVIPPAFPPMIRSGSAGLCQRCCPSRGLQALTTPTTLVFSIRPQPTRPQSESHHGSDHRLSPRSSSQSPVATDRFRCMG